MEIRPRPRIYPAKPSEKAYAWFVEQFGFGAAPDEFTKRYGADGEEFLPGAEEEPKAEETPKETPKAPKKAPKKAPRKKKG